MYCAPEAVLAIGFNARWAIVAVMVVKLCVYTTETAVVPLHLLEHVRNVKGCHHC